MIPWGQKRVAMIRRMDISAALQGCITKESGDLVCDSLKKYRKAKPRLISALLSIFANLSLGGAATARMLQSLILTD